MTSSLADAPLLRAARRLPVPFTPVWFMRQAGRSLPEYRAARGDGPIVAAIADPALAAELTLQPVRRHGVDAAVLFSDIIVPVLPFGVEIVAGRGPVVERPFRSIADLDRLRPLEPGGANPDVAATVALCVAELGSVPLIGFAGAPFTVASYLVEGGPSRTFATVKALMHTDPVLWTTLVERLGDFALDHLLDQIDAGASAVQLFDSWAGALSPADYRRFALPSTRRIVGELHRRRPDIPVILFGVDTGELLCDMATAGPDVLGVDWRVPLGTAAARLGPHLALQGNLDPALCLAPWSVVEHAATTVLDEARGLPGHIFNLGHGVLPETDPGILTALCEFVHAGTQGAAP